MRRFAALWILFLLFCAALLYSLFTLPIPLLILVLVLPAMPIDDSLTWAWLFAFLVLAILMGQDMGFSLARLSRIFVQGEAFIFDRSTNQFLRNKKELCHLDQIDCLVIRRYEGAYSNEMTLPDGWGLLVNCKDGKRILMDKSISEENIRTVAQEICRHIGQEIPREEFIPAFIKFYWRRRKL